MIVNEGGGGKKLPTLTNPGTAANLLSGKQLINQNGEIVTGSMTDRGAVTQALNAGGSYAIPAGYHNGAGKVTANSLSSQTSGTATAADIRSGKTAWVNGTRLTGSGQIAQKTSFGFLVGSRLANSLTVSTDISLATEPDGEYKVSRGDSSAHTFECTVGSIIVIDMASSDEIAWGSSLVGFERIAILDDGFDTLITLQCTEAEGIIRVNF